MPNLVTIASVLCGIAALITILDRVMTWSRTTGKQHPFLVGLLMMAAVGILGATLIFTLRYDQ